MLVVIIPWFDKDWDFLGGSYLFEGLCEKSRSLNFAIFHFDGDHCDCRLLQIPKRRWFKYRNDRSRDRDRGPFR